jgi:hypothetical protein
MRPAIVLMVMASLLAASALATPSAADQIPLRTMPPYQRSDKTCLSIHYDGAAAYWLNHCSYPVSVRWDDEDKCQNWSCLDEVPANTRSSAAISRHPRWCECPGTLKTCNLPAKDCN